MTIKEQISALESRQLELQAIMRRTDAHAMKCSKQGLSYKDTYPDEYAEYVEANAQYNDNEVSLSELEKQRLSEIREDEQNDNAQEVRL